MEGIRGPLGDYVEQINPLSPGNELRRGYARALQTWTYARNSLQEKPRRQSFCDGLSLSQLHSLELLAEWWDAKAQDAALARACQVALQQAASQAASQDDEPRIDRLAAKLDWSTYHSLMFTLFQMEFLHEFRMMHTGEPAAFVGIVQAQRQLCAQHAALQRMSHAVVTAATRPAQPPAQATLEQMIAGRHIAACIEPCPWLNHKRNAHELPYYLWDVSGQRTIETSSLEQRPEYVCVSHTWGRWLRRGSRPARIPGVPWDVPQNTKFHVNTLPAQLKAAFGSGFVWFDLLCIPQDRSERALMEISRQATIFAGCKVAIAWLNDAVSWDCLTVMVKWCSMYYRSKTILEDTEDAKNTRLSDDEEEQLTYLIEFMTSPTDDDFDGSPQTALIDKAHGNASDGDESEDGAVPIPWFTSLWTLQEICLRPDMVVCDRGWRPLHVGHGTLVTFDSLVAISDILSRLIQQDQEASQVFPLSPQTNEVLKYSSEDEGGGSQVSPPDVAAFDDLNTFLGVICMNALHWTSPAAVFTSGQLRECTSRRSEAIMSVVGATRWFTDHLLEHGSAPSEENLVLGFYALPFIREACEITGPSFFAALPLDLDLLNPAIVFDGQKWSLRDQWRPIGSMMPFTGSNTTQIPTINLGFGAYAHPSVQTWQIHRDGSVHITEAAVLHDRHFDGHVLHEENPLKVDNLWVPVPTEDSSITFETEVSAVDCSLKTWLDTFCSPDISPNRAVCLYQNILYDRSIPGPQTGIILKQVGINELGQALMVKVGVYLANAVAAWDIQAIDVDWLVL